MILLKKPRKIEDLSISITNSATRAKVAQVSNLVYLVERYKQIISNIDLDATNKLKLTSINKYKKYTGSVKMKLNWLQDKNLALVTFLRHLY